MSGLHRLFREARRAGAFTRRLERSLEPARQMGAASGEWALLRIDERLAGLVGAADPFSSLETVLSRIAGKPAADEQQLRILRHGDATGTRPLGERRQPMRSEVAVPARRRAPLSEQTAAAQPTNGVVPPGLGPAPVAAVASAAETSVRLGQPPPAPRAGHRDPGATADAAAVDQQAVRAPGFDPLRPAALPRTTIVESRAAAAQSNHAAAHLDRAPASHSNRAAAPTPEASIPAGSLPADSLQAGSLPAVSIRAASIPTVSATRAAEIFSERMQSSNSLQAFRSVVRVAASPETDPEPQALSSVVGRTSPAPQSPIAVAIGRSVPEAAADLEAADRERAAAGSAALVEAAHAPRRRSPNPVVDTTLSGLRRLAALATDSLDGPNPDAEAVRPSQPALCVEEELDRILRVEALRHGIPTDGLVR